MLSLDTLEGLFTRTVSEDTEPTALDEVGLSSVRGDSGQYTPQGGGA